MEGSQAANEALLEGLGETDSDRAVDTAIVACGAPSRVPCPLVGSPASGHRDSNVKDRFWNNAMLNVCNG